MRISIIIPTRNRSEPLTKLLLSLFCQTRLPEEVIVVDDSDDDKTSKLVNENCTVFLNKGILLKYSRGNKANRSISAARNIGATRSSGEIVFFLDDDVILDSGYIEEILTTYEEYSTAKGVQGYIVSGGTLSNFRSILLNSISKVFFIDHLEKNKCSYQLGLTYPYSPNNIIRCQWLHGTNSSYRKEVLQSFRFDENLKRRSIGEDVDLSYRINKFYPNSLLMNSRARLTHVQTPRAHFENKPVIYSATPYFVYLFAKNFKQTIQNKVLLLWVLLGRLIVECGMYLVSRDIESVFWSIKSYICTSKNLKDVKKGDFRFLDPIIQ